MTKTEANKNTFELLKKVIERDGVPEHLRYAPWLERMNWIKAFIKLGAPEAVVHDLGQALYFPSEAVDELLGKRQKV